MYERAQRALEWKITSDYERLRLASLADDTGKKVVDYIAEKIQGESKCRLRDSFWNDIEKRFDIGISIRQRSQWTRGCCR